VRAYLGIVSLRLGGRLAFAIDPLEASVADARIPPMMLLPLVDHAVTRGFAKPDANGTLRVRTSIAGGKVRLAIADSGVGFLSENQGDGVTGIRERLALLFGERASLALNRREAGATEAVLEIPIETAQPHADAGTAEAQPPAASSPGLEAPLRPT
jgi:LytS/YehU family sensor histidine kinase